MNPNNTTTTTTTTTHTEPPLPALQPPQPPQPHRPSTSCDRHPDEHFTGFCPSCLCERLSLLDPNNKTANNNNNNPPPRFKPPTSSTATAALKAIFKGTGNNNNGNSSSSNSGLRRTKSFSASKNEGFSGVFEPQRKSCDVRVRNTLWSLFSQDDDRKFNSNDVAEGSSGVPKQKEEVEIEEDVKGKSIEVEEEEDEEEGYIEVFDDDNVGVVGGRVSVSEERVPEIVEEEEEDEGVEEVRDVEDEEVEVKSIKDHIDLDSHVKKSSGRDFKEIAGSFWSAASVFSKKLQKWRQKQKMKKRRNGGGSGMLPVEKSIRRQMRETQSEIADYGFGRRSCDTDPRFSLDAGRMSFDAGRVSFDAARMSFDAARMSVDDPRYSFDEPRASWDGYLVGRTLPPRMPTMLSVVEDAPVHVVRTDNQIPVEEPLPMNLNNEDIMVPGGTSQTRDYYLDSSSRRRKSLDRSNSIRKTAAAVVAEIDEMKVASTSNSKVSPATTDYLHGLKSVVPDRDTNSNHSSSIRDDCSEAIDTGFRDNASVIGNGERKGTKKSWRWSKAWSLWGFIYRRGGNKEDDDDRYSKANGVERSFSESWQDLRGERNGDARGAFNRKVFRSNSSVSWRNSSNFGGGGGGAGLKKIGMESNGHNRKKRDEFVLERNRSARYSPNNVENGLLRFYLTPMRNSRRNGWGKNRSSQAHSFARSVLRLY